MRRLFALLALLLGLALFACVSQSVTTDPEAAALLICGAISLLLLALLDRTRERLASVTLRAAADLALLTPVLAPLFTNILRR